MPIGAGYDPKMDLHPKDAKMFRQHYNRILAIYYDKSGPLGIHKTNTMPSRMSVEQKQKFMKKGLYWGDNRPLGPHMYQKTQWLPEGHKNALVWPSVFAEDATLPGDLADKSPSGARRTVQSCRSTKNGETQT